KHVFQIHVFSSQKGWGGKKIITVFEIREKKGKKKVKKMNDEKISAAVVVFTGRLIFLNHEI
ncbi:hypothetical protein DERF_009671, partial [Dermatophagoides farinae]